MSDSCLRFKLGARVSNGLKASGGGFIGSNREAVEDHSPGLQPWVASLKSGALKVAPEVIATGGISALSPEHIHRSPLSGRFNCLPDPGLKPWANFCHRFAVNPRAHGLDQC